MQNTSLPGKGWNTGAAGANGANGAIGAIGAIGATDAASPAGDRPAVQGVPLLGFIVALSLLVVYVCSPWMG